MRRVYCVTMPDGVQYGIPMENRKDEKRKKFEGKIM